MILNKQKYRAQPRLLLNIFYNVQAPPAQPVSSTSS